MTDQEPEKQKARQVALRRLDRRECSAADISQTLRRKGFSQDIITEVVQDLVERKWIDDEKFASILVRDQALRGKGSKWIQMKLRTQGIQAESETISELIQSTTNASELQVAQSLIRRRYPQAKEDPSIAKKAIQALLRRGFTYEIARKAISTSMNDDSEG